MRFVIGAGRSRWGGAALSLFGRDEWADGGRGRRGAAVGAKVGEDDGRIAVAGFAADVAVGAKLRRPCAAGDDELCPACRRDHDVADALHGRRSRECVERNAVEGDEIERLAVDAEVEITSGGRVDDAEELAFVRIDADDGARRTVDGDLHAGSRQARLADGIVVVDDGEAAGTPAPGEHSRANRGRPRGDWNRGEVGRRLHVAQHDDALAQYGQRRKMPLQALDDQRPRHSAGDLPVRLPVRVRMVPIQSRRLAAWDPNVVRDRCSGRRKAHRIVGRGVRRNGQPVEVKVHVVRRVGSGGKMVVQPDAQLVAGGDADRRSDADFAAIGERGGAGRRVDRGIEVEAHDAVLRADFGDGRHRCLRRGARGGGRELWGLCRPTGASRYREQRKCSG